MSRLRFDVGLGIGVLIGVEGRYQPVGSRMGGQPPIGIRSDIDPDSGPDLDVDPARRVEWAEAMPFSRS